MVGVDVTGKKERDIEAKALSSKPTTVRVSDAILIWASFMHPVLSCEYRLQFNKNRIARRACIEERTAAVVYDYIVVWQFDLSQVD